MGEKDILKESKNIIENHVSEILTELKSMDETQREKSQQNKTRIETVKNMQNSILKAAIRNLDVTEIKENVCYAVGVAPTGFDAKEMHSGEDFEEIGEVKEQDLQLRQISYALTSVFREYAIKRKEIYEYVLDSYAELKTMLSLEREKLTEKVNKIKCESIEAEEQLKKSLEHYEIVKEEISTLEKEKNELEFRENKAKGKVKKVFSPLALIPGYSLYLAIDAIADSDVRNLKILYGEIARKRDELGKRIEEIEALREKAQTSSDIGTRCVSWLMKLDQLDREITSLINDSSHKIVEASVDGEIYGSDFSFASNLMKK